MGLRLRALRTSAQRSGRRAYLGLSLANVCWKRRHVAMMTSTDVRRFVDHALGLGNSGDLDGLAGLFDPNVVMVGPDGTVKGSEAVRAAFDVLYTAFPGLQVEINRLIVEDDWVAYTATATGTHGGPLRLPDGRVIAPPNQPVTLRLVN